ncbi:MAG: two-component system chemotaxis response regulator CheB [Phenylobacterium sp.]|jgi:two-component system chemotaxis response regulator CheB
MALRRPEETMMAPPIKLLLADDSPLFCLLLQALLEADRDIAIIGVATNGKEAIEMSQRLQPDLVIMDINMPMINGIEATRLIMATAPTPIIITSNTPTIDQDLSFRAIEEGALSVMEKPQGYAHPGAEKNHNDLLDTIKAMAAVPVVRRRLPGQPHFASSVFACAGHCANNDANNSAVPATPPALTPPLTPPLTPANKSYELIAIGCSTGGPQALLQILSPLPTSLPVPIVIVQHISSGFIEGLAKWLQNHTQLPLHIGKHNQILLPGNIYLAPDEHHLLIGKTTTTDDQPQLQLRLSTSPAVNHVRPSIDVLFNAIAQDNTISTIAMLLTGMGSDGVDGLTSLHQHSRNFTMVQDEQSAVIWGMAGTAVAQGVVDKIVDLERTSKYLLGLVI